MATYRKRPVEVEAERVSTLIHAAAYDWASLPPWAVEAYERGDLLFLPAEVRVRTLEGLMTGGQDDWLIRGVQGEIYPCKPAIFAATYEPVEVST